MKYILLVGVFSVVCLNILFAQHSNYSSFKDKLSLQIEDSASKKTYSMQVFLPINYSTNQKYPVIYFFDADNAILTNAYLSTIDALSYYKNIPEVIVVGVCQNDRSDELGIFKNLDSNGFIHFVRTDLKSEIDRNYSTIGYNSYIGHSLGGQLLTYAFIKYPADFYSIITFSPALYYPDNKDRLAILEDKIIDSLSRRLGQHQHINAYYYCSVGDSGFQDSQFLKGVNKVEKVFREGSSESFNYKFDYLNGYTHAISPNGGLTNGLLFLFNDWIFSEDLAMKILLEHKIDGLESLNNQLEKIRMNYMGKQIALPKMVFNNLYNYYFQKQEYDKAVKVRELQIESVSDPLIYSEIAECYKRLGDVAKYELYLEKSRKE
ncbi:alpha/beta hydrolase-fold protein [Sphingobacterium oryzagri]|uniref:Alpha/beta hydrolase-fold protein n=1 Tax=Sphingobacterium oryzagri TaxID=3025669 RepID=A0ABY7WPS9_9SPHI|nr:alpha/beta hydrolase-fold protein [Sphingobacterium sp. KACC 22765]WDF70423.1 alpha/beta hydrolase-fold protein [Sphingobacterium sp. KACC 22765]